MFASWTTNLKLKDCAVLSDKQAINDFKGGNKYGEERDASLIWAHLRDFLRLWWADFCLRLCNEQTAKTRYSNGTNKSMKQMKKFLFWDKNKQRKLQAKGAFLIYTTIAIDAQPFVANSSCRSGREQSASPNFEEHPGVNYKRFNWFKFKLTNIIGQ